MTSTRKQPAPDPRAELLARLRAGLTPDDPAYVHTYAERTPERDYLRVWGTTPPIATYSDMEHHQRFLVAYGPHNLAGLWCYALPDGVAVASKEPDGWTGWREAGVEPDREDAP